MQCDTGVHIAVYARCQVQILVTNNVKEFITVFALQAKHWVKKKGWQTDTKGLQLRIYLRYSILCCLFFIALLSGCSSSQQYVMLARDGASYSGSVAVIADRANAVRIESSSYFLLHLKVG